MSADGRLVALHGDGIDVVVSGSLPADELRAVAADLGVVGRAVPPGWSEAASATLAGAARALPGLLVAPGDLDGFGGRRRSRVDGDTVVPGLRRPRRPGLHPGPGATAAT